MKKVFIEFHNGEKIEEEIRNFSLYSAHKKVTFAWWNLKDRRKTYLKNDLKSAIQ